MSEHDISRAGWTLTGRRLVAVLTMASALSSAAAEAQTRTARDTATAYGARLNARGEPANLNPNRINDRVNSRLETRLSLRVERYRVSSASDPAAAFAAQPTDNARVGTNTTLSPLSTSQQGDATSSSQTTPGPTDAAARPR